MRETAIVMDASAGVAAARHRAAEIGKRLRRAGRPAAVHIVARAEVALTVREAVAAGTRLLVLGSGPTATVSAAASALAGTDCSLAILPLGISPELARYTRRNGIPVSIEEAAQAILAGKTRLINVAEVNGRFFLGSSVVAPPHPYGDLFRRSQRAVRDWPHNVAWRALKVRLRTDTLSVMMRASSIRIEVCSRHPRRPGDSPRDVEPGHLSLRIARPPALLGLDAVVRGVMARYGYSQQRADSADTLQCGSVSLEFDRSRIDVANDDESRSMYGPLHYHLRPQALRVVVSPRVVSRGNVYQLVS